MLNRYEEAKSARTIVTNLSPEGLARRGHVQQRKKIRARWRSRSTCRDSQTQKLRTRLSMQRRPRNGALLERRVGQLPNVGSVGAHHVNIAVLLCIAGM